MAPTCSLSSPSLQLTGSAAKIIVTVGTTPSVATSTVPDLNFPPGTMPLAWTAMLLTSGWLLLRNRKLVPRLAAPLVVLALASWVGCGSGGSPHTTPGTSVGTYTATITATSGSQNHNLTLTVVVE